nr:phosphopantetheine-binding protein [Massilia rubra]
MLRCIGKTAPYISSFSLDDRFVDLDFDSLRFIQLIVQLEHALGVEFDDEKLNPTSFERIGDLLAYLETLTPSAASAPEKNSLGQDQ